MINGESVLAIIPARGGSKRVPHKNIRIVGDKPLIAWTIEEAKTSKYIDRLVLSSDSDTIIDIAQKWGCEVPFKRESRLASDKTPGIDVVLDAIDRCPGYDWVVLLQPTSPLRKAQDIDAALEMCVNLSAPACVSVCEVDQLPYWMYTIDKNSRITPLIPDSKVNRTQDAPPVYLLNGAVYVAQTNWLKQQENFKSDQTIAYTMPRNRSLDIDTETDLGKLEISLSKSYDFPEFR
jgi:N-acylneuraminate cytidylyltransferase